MPGSKQCYGENLSREWDLDPQSDRLWDALQLTKRDPSAGLGDLSLLARQGSGLSMMYLGDIYLHGRYGIKRDPELAAKWLDAAAYAGSIEAAYIYAFHLWKIKRFEESLALYNIIAKENYAPAQFVLGWKYLHGDYVERDLTKALHFFHLADRQGHLIAGQWICHILMKEISSPTSWFRGFIKKIWLTIPFVKCKIFYPKSDRLRT